MLVRFLVQFLEQSLAQSLVQSLVRSLLQSLVQSLVPPQDHAKITPRPRQDHPLKKYQIFIKNIDFSLEKCKFGAHRGVLHYVFRRKRVILRKNGNFELEICAKARGERTALQPQASSSLR